MDAEGKLADDTWTDDRKAEGRLACNHIWAAVACDRKEQEGMKKEQDEEGRTERPRSQLPWQGLQQWW